MKILTRILPVLVWFTATAAAGSLEDLQGSFMARYDEANATRDGQLKQLESSYLAALGRHLDKVKGSGDLERVVPVRDEIEAIKAGKDPLPEIPGNADAEMKNMRGKYATARAAVVRKHAETLVGLADKMSTALENEEKELTRSGRIDDALAAKRMRETLAEDGGIASARGLLGAAGKPALATEPAEWGLLLKTKMKVEEKGIHPVGSLSEVAQGGRGFWNRMLTGGQENPEEVLVTPSPCKVSFAPKLPVTELRGRVSLAFPGARPTVRIKAGGETVFEEALGGRDRGSRIELKFDATREITIEAESGDGGPAWIYWTDFEAR